ncbi:MAG: ABC transporter substrate-binding protein, partial [Xanthobacteraceae bacterium]
MKKVVCALLLGGAVGLFAGGSANAQDKTVKIGVLNDQSGLYADAGGPGSTLAAQMAVEDSGLRDKGWTIEVISGDHQNKPDIGSSIARRWFDVDKVDVIADVPNSGVALAINNIVKEKNGVYINSGNSATTAASPIPPATRAPKRFARTTAACARCTPRTP